MPTIQQVILLSLLALIINLPLGWWRSTVQKFSVSWFLAIHLSVPFIYAVRLWAGVSSYIIPFLIIFAVIGQIIGSKLYAAD